MGENRGEWKLVMISGFIPTGLAYGAFSPAMRAPLFHHQKQQ
jgi:hypothetical protein